MPLHRPLPLVRWSGLKHARQSQIRTLPMPSPAVSRLTIRPSAATFPRLGAKRCSVGDKQLVR